MNRYEYDEAGTLRHYINEELRAIVPPESVAEYRAIYDDAPKPPKAPKAE